MNVRHAAAACALLAAAPCLASVQWLGDFESGNLSQYSSKESVSSDRLSVVTDPVRQGKYALKVTVKHGDNPNRASGNRNELIKEGGTKEGSEAYYRWSTMFAPDFPSAKTWQLFAQYHHPENTGSPPLQLYVYGEEMRMTVSPAQTQVWHAPLQRGVWNDFVLHVRFSDDPKVGFVELWHDGKLVVPKTFATTRANGYLKLGLYRDAKVQQEGVLYHDGMMRADSLEDVMSPTRVTKPTEVASASEPVREEQPAKASSKKQRQGRPGPATRERRRAASSPGGSSCGATEGGPALALGLLAGGALLQRQRRRRATALR